MASVNYGKYNFKNLWRFDMRKYPWLDMIRLNGIFMWNRHNVRQCEGNYYISAFRRRV